VKLLPYGPRAVLAEFESLDEVLAADAAWEGLDGVVDLVPAARTVLVVHEAGFDRASLVPPARGGPAVGRSGFRAAVVVPVRYDGADLAEVARAAGMTIDAVIASHLATEYRVAFCGFMPGFSYLIGLDVRLHLPRRATPRTRVPAGAVAIAGEFTGVYPRKSPGGWHLLGTTSLPMWDEASDPAAALPPGATVRFVRE
jgi:KipI family sensor histidine kinase inhibitor